MILKFKTTADNHLKSKNVAVAGVSNDKTKFGGRVFRNLKKRGYNVYPLNPKLKEFDGEKCFPAIDELPENIELLICVTPPPITETLIKEAAENGIKQVWLQPGAESKEAIRLCRKKGISVVSKTCIMMSS
ncbi:MAG: CoA-binding protein [Spirochaetales bacterium]|uniref:CoA-binding protein n=1 Tax=Candidatus Thalassospirochaeta sargassi TaxID=3119039 RepID=A0AAJ1ID36_9SPIO|nr:CoA-binding protein [Spirochaetales bacterium]